MRHPESLPAPPERETADIETSSDGYAARFSGAVGAWMLGVQESLALDWLARYPRASVLDVGGGHGQLALPLSRRGYSVTVVGSGPGSLRRLQGEVDAGRIRFFTSNLVSLPFSDQTFDVGVSIRLLPHCRQWRTLIAELCRVSRHAVIVDYPTRQSLNCLSFAFFGAKKRIEGNTRPYALFAHAEVEVEFARHGYRLEERKPEFFLPLVLHRVLRMPRLSAALEVVSRALRLTRYLGSPVLVKMARMERR